MTYEMKIFNNDEFNNVRTVIIDDELWFIGTDVANNLEYQNGSRDINRHVDKENIRKIMLFNGKQNRATIVINEAGVYSLILSSKQERAKRFKKWVVSEILPSIYRTGNYSIDGSYNSINHFNPNEFMKAFQNMTNQMVNIVDSLSKLTNTLCQNISSNINLSNIEISDNNSFINNCNRLKENSTEEMNNIINFFMNAANKNNTNLTISSIPDTPLNLRDTAKALGIRPGTFTNWLINNNYVYREKDYNYVCPYDKYTTGDHEYFTTRKWRRGAAYGIQTLVTPFGIQTFTSIFSE